MLRCFVRSFESWPQNQHVEKDPVARGVARQSIVKILKRYPHLLPLSAVQGFDIRLGNKVERVGIIQLENYGAHYAKIDFVGAGFPCQPMLLVEVLASGTIDLHHFRYGASVIVVPK